MKKETPIDCDSSAIVDQVKKTTVQRILDREVLEIQAQTAVQKIMVQCLLGEKILELKSEVTT